jgi:hypothetical protein
MSDLNFVGGPLLAAANQIGTIEHTSMSVELAVPKSGSAAASAVFSVREGASRLGSTCPHVVSAAGAAFRDWRTLAEGRAAGTDRRGNTRKESHGYQRLSTRSIWRASYSMTHAPLWQRLGT